MLIDTLAATDPEVNVYTWYAPDHSAGFWYRRMAHETAVHRVDIELSQGPPSPIATDLAVDGLDEVLGPIMCGLEPAGFRENGQIVLLLMSDAGTQRRLLLGEGEGEPGWVLAEGGADGADATITCISAAASNLDLWAWGRLPADVLEVDGDASVVNWIREMVRQGTQ
jgi:uncharacterized protein (TIGR03083 family)